MQVDINVPKSRSFNIFLRFFQLGLHLVIAVHVTKFGENTCSIPFKKLLEPISYLFTGLNLLAMIYTRCRDKFPRIQFFVFYAIDIILSGVVIVMGFAGVGEAASCAQGQVLSRFAFIDAAFILAISVMILVLPFAWIQRYSNSPGNLTWVILFCSFPFPKSVRGWMIMIGLICLAISLLTLLVNGISACKGTTTTIKKAIVITWIFTLFLMIVCEVLAIITYLGNHGNEQEGYFQVLAKKVLQIFVPVNLLDLLFWIWGLLTLTYENGDNIRDALMTGDPEEGFHYPQEHNGYLEAAAEENIGTLK